MIETSCTKVTTVFYQDGPDTNGYPYRLIFIWEGVHHNRGVILSSRELSTPNSLLPVNWRL